MRFLIILFVIISVLYPFYIDIRILPSVGINPQRIILLTMFILSLVKTKFRITKLFFLDKWMFIVFSYVTVRFIITVINFNGYSLSHSIYEFFSILMLSVFVFNYLEYKDIYLIGKIFFYASFLIAFICLTELVLGYNVFSILAPSGGRAAAGAITEKYRGGLIRVKGTFENPLTLMQYVIFTFPIIVLYIKKKGYYKFVMYSSAIILNAFMIIFTLSRFGIIFFFFEVFIIFIWGWGINHMLTLKRVGITVIVVGSFILLLPQTLYFIENATFDNSNSIGLFASVGREAQLYWGKEAINRNPILGIGIGHAGEYLNELSKTDLSKPRMYDNKVTDNRFLTIAVETGLITVILFLGMLYLSYRNINNIKLLQERRLMLLSFLGLFLSLIILSIFTLYPLIFVVFAILNKKKYARKFIP